MTRKPAVDMSHEIDQCLSEVSKTPDLKIHQLKYLIAIAEQGSLRLAALSSGVSVAAISKGLHELEKAVGMTLLERRTQGATLTPVGHGLLSRARVIVNEVQEAVSDISRMRATVETKLAVGVTPWIATSLLPLTVNRFLAVRPDVSLTFVETLGNDYSALREGLLDMAVGLAPENTPSYLISRPLFSYGQVVVCRRGHPLQNARSLAELHDQSWVMSHDFMQHKSPLREFFIENHGPASSLNKGRLHYSKSVLIALQMVEKSDVLCVMPYPLLEAVRDRFRIEGLFLNEQLSENTTSYLTRHNTQISCAIAEFITALIDTVKTDCQNDNRALRRVYHSFESLTKV